MDFSNGQLSPLPQCIFVGTICRFYEAQCWCRKAAKGNELNGIHPLKEVGHYRRSSCIFCLLDPEYLGDFIYKPGDLDS